MNKAAKRLTARTVQTAKPGKTYHDGQGLYLRVSKNGMSKKFSYRYTNPDTHRVTETGLGSTKAITLAEARNKAHDTRKLVASGVNPITAKRGDRLRKAARQTFGACAEAVIATKASEGRNDKHREQWATTLRTYAAPLWRLPVDGRYRSCFERPSTTMDKSPRDCFATAGQDRGGFGRSARQRGISLEMRLIQPSGAVIWTRCYRSARGSRAAIIRRCDIMMCLNSSAVYVRSKPYRHWLSNS